MYRVGIIISSDKGAAGERRDGSGPLIEKMLPGELYRVVSRRILPDEQEPLREELLRLCTEMDCDLVLTSGGTGFSPRDIMPEVTLSVATRTVPGIAEAIRAYSLTKTKRAALSRAASVIRDRTWIINLPGSPKAVAEIMEYLADILPHGLSILSGNAGDCAAAYSDRVLIRGAGDMATGIACRLHRSGFQVLMTEQAQPTTVRRMAAFSRAVYENTAVVEGIEALLCGGSREAAAAVLQDKVAVVVDEEGSIRHTWRPEAVVDSILAKKNLGTGLRDAEIVIGVGPGFTAGTDCHCVVETKRGHDLGRCICSGSATPNTGVPGTIGGYDVERILRAGCAGKFRGLLPIGTTVEQGTIVAYVGEMPVRAQIAGIVRGLLQDGVEVYAGMKSGDIDPRGIPEYCYTVSDKARAVGGGVLEAILFLKKNKFKR